MELGYELFAQFLEQGEQEFVEITLVFASPEFARAFLGREIQAGQALAGKGVYHKTVYDTRARLNRVTFDPDGFTLTNGLRYEYTSLGNPLMNLFQYNIYMFQSVSLENCVFLPLSEIDFFYDINPAMTNCSLHYMPSNPEDTAAIAEINRMITEYLSQQHDAGSSVVAADAGYKPVNLLSEYQSVADFQAQNLRLYAWVANLCMVIVIMGLIGQLIVHFIRRRAEIAVRQMLGATRFSVFMALLFEVGLVCVTGGLLGLLAAWPITARLLTSYLAPMTYHLEAVWVIAACILVMAAAPTLFVFSFICRDKPVELLKSL